MTVTTEVAKVDYVADNTFNTASANVVMEGNEKSIIQN